MENTYTAKIKNKYITVTAQSYTEAAIKCANRAYRRKTLDATRSSGDFETAGYYVPYEPCKFGGWNRLDDGFQIRRH